MKDNSIRINERIIAHEVRVLGATGENFGVMPFRDALAKAKEEGLDLVEVAGQADPPVCRIVDFQKFLFARKKQERKAKSGTKKSELKEFRFGPTIGDHDLNVRLGRARKFLETNNKVKFTIRFRGRQMAHPELGFEIMKQVGQTLRDVGKEEAEAKKQGNTLSVTFVPAKTS